MAGSHTLEFSDQNFEQEVLNSPQPVLVDFWATWCAPCRMMSPTVDIIAAEYAGRVKVGKVNVDDNLAVAGRFGIRSIPTLLLFKGGQIREQIGGAQPKEVISRLLDKYID
ncbi:MAG TPA: thioredoxin [Terriglobia bacterium]|nr:thioredoxin [Terriglobia bacterium]